MIRRLRQAHRLVFVFLALAIPVLLTRAFASRPLSPRSAQLLPAGGAISTSDITATWVTQLGALRYRLDQPNVANSPAFIAFGPAATLRGPDLLVYWTSRAAPVATIEDGDLLLGRLDGAAPVVIPLPPAASDSFGTLVLYSLAHRSVVGTLALPAAQGARP